METYNRDVAVVLSGGAVNGVLMELGFLRRVRESPLWPRVGWIFGTSAGALAGTMAALDRLDELERFLLALRPDDVFRPNRLWRLPLLGTHYYALPRTIEDRVGDLVALAEELAACERELVVCATDVSESDGAAAPITAELVYSAWTTPPPEFARAILASAAISALVLPLRVGDRIATDGAWTRNFPLGHAYERPEVNAIVAFRYIARYPRVDTEPLARLRNRLRRFERVPPVRALMDELREAEERDRRGEPAHMVEMIRRLMRVTVAQNTLLEERVAREKDESIAELDRLRADVAELVRLHARDPAEAEALVTALEQRFAASCFPFRSDRRLPTAVVRGSADDASLETNSRSQPPWTEEAKRRLIERGYELTDAELAKHPFAAPTASVG